MYDISEKARRSLRKSSREMEEIERRRIFCPQADHALQNKETCTTGKQKNLSSLRHF